MSTKGVFAIILNDEKDRVLLVKRRDYPIWDLPGGKLESEESIEECAIRETVEETGYLINIDQKVGKYNRFDFNDIQYVFSAKVIGGKKIKIGEESRAVKWIDINKLPYLMVPHRKGQIKDFFNGNYPINKMLYDSKFIICMDNISRRIRRR